MTSLARPRGDDALGWLERGDLPHLAAAFGDLRLALPLGLPLDLHPEVALRMAEARWRACRDGRSSCLVSRDAAGLRGAFTLVRSSADPGRAELSFWVIPAARRQGLAGRGVDRLLSEAWSRFDLRGVDARCLAVNRAARRLLAGRGFRRAEGERREEAATGHHLFRLDRPAAQGAS